MRLLVVILAVLLDAVPAGDAYLKQLQPRDSILIADQLEYGFQLDETEGLEGLALPDFSPSSGDTLALVRGWKLDTLSAGILRGSVVLAPFEPGTYVLPDIALLRLTSRGEDTLLFKGQTIEVITIPIDTATFVFHDIKAQMTYPVTFKEILPYALAVLLLAALVWLAIRLIRRYRVRRGLEAAPGEPAYIVALRRLDRYKSDKFWAPDKQKAFYSGVTDALKFYIDETFSIDAPEMTTAELFNALKSRRELTPELFDSARELFERADFVKFAKYTATAEENAGVLPVAVSFVTSTYNTAPEEGQDEDVL